jgi:hypothetical protein
MGLWKRLFGPRESDGDASEREWGETLRRAGMRYP